jgi:ribosomal protein L37AE/L43A
MDIDIKNFNIIIYNHINRCYFCETEDCCVSTFIRGNFGYYICENCVHDSDTSDYQPVMNDDNGVMIYINR